jgi:pyridoxamine--pyruvate transaminase
MAHSGRQPHLNLSCGQTDLHIEAREAMARPLPQPIYYPPFHELEGDCLLMLRTLLHTTADVLLPIGSATYGEEAAFSTILEKDDTCVTVNTGLFGQVLTDLVRIVGAQPVEIKLPPGQSVTVEQARASLQAHPQARMLAVVHVETAAGTVNPVREIGSMIREDFPHVLYLVDAVSSLTSEPLFVDQWGIDVCCTSAQKCLNGPQGISIVSVSERAWNAIEGRRSPIPGLCLDLVTWRHWHESEAESRALDRGELQAGQVAVDSSVTMYKAAHGPSESYPLLLALQAVLQAIINEGEDEVIARHAASGYALRSGVRAMGLRVLADEENAAACSTCIVVPGDSFPTQQYMKTVWREHGIATAGGSERPDEHGYTGSRVGLMGAVATLDSVRSLLAAMEEVLPRFGVEVESGAAVAAAAAAYQAAAVPGDRATPAGSA